MAGHLVQFVTKDIAELAHCPVYIWGDNRAALGWCTSDNIEDIYIFRRVTCLRELCPSAQLRGDLAAEIWSIWSDWSILSYIHF